MRARRREQVLAALVLLAALLVALPRVLHVVAAADVRIAGDLLPRGDPQAFLAATARRWAQQSLQLDVGHHVFRPSREELGATRAVDDALAELHALGRSPNPLVALRAWWRGRTRGQVLRWRPRVDERALDRYVESVRAEVDRLPVPGSYDPAGSPIAGLPGEAVDVTSMKRALSEVLMRDAASVQVDTVITPPPAALRRFAEPGAAASVLMMTQETTFRDGGRGRAVNIELAAHKLDGVLLMPGGSFSFNATVGKRERARGFAPAPELINGEVVEGIGGGVCQVAGTLHAAAFFAGLLVDEYRPHSRLMQLAYLRPGLDTMVAWPDHVHALRDTKDLRLRNPYPFPIVIRTRVTHQPGRPATLRVALYGAAKPFRVDYRFEELDQVPAGQVRRAVPSLPTGVQRIQQESEKGLVIMRRRTIYMPTGVVQEATRVAYPPTPRVVLTGSAS